ncbi:MAG: DUF389 domain-containing protein [Nocardioidaceae bacterium]
MLHVRVIAPADTTDAVIERIDGDVTVVNRVVVRGVAQCRDGRSGDLLMFDLARENANPVIADLRALHVDDAGSIALDEADTILSKAADDAERAAPGRPEDGVIWDAIEAKADDDARMSWSFLTFLVLATLIAGTGRYLDQPILIVGAMVVGPEFAPVSAICYGLARWRTRLVPTGLATLLGGFAIASAVSLAVWAVAYALGGIDARRASTGPMTNFIVQPDIWSLIVALLAGTAGVLSLTASKSAALVGVFISVTTVPAAGTIALTLAVGDFHEAGSSLVQLLVNIAGMIVAGTVTLLVQRAVWHQVGERRGVRPVS